MRSNGKSTHNRLSVLKVVLPLAHLCSSSKNRKKTEDKRNKMNTNNGNQQSRKWMLTINNPLEYDCSQEKIEKKLSNLGNCVYYCMSDEVGLENKTYHTHLYVVFKSPMRFSTIKKAFPTAHIDKPQGTSEQVRDYIFKIGCWVSDKKADTKVEGTQREWGELPQEKQGKRNDLNKILPMIVEGCSNTEIMEAIPSSWIRIDKIERARQAIIFERNKDIFRNLNVTYISGITGTGKTRGVMEKNGYSNVFRLTNYGRGGFDGYSGQDVITFEEFNSRFEITDMLNYLDGYPLTLPCRYADKVACYTKVYIISNIPLEQQYKDIQINKPEQWKAFLRRINQVIVYDAQGVATEFDIKEYTKLYMPRFYQVLR